MKRFTLVLGLCVALAMVLVACGGGSKKPAASPTDAGHAGKPVETTGPATTPGAPGLASCPVKPATNCAFAVTVRDWVAAAGIDSLVAGSVWDTPGKTLEARRLIDAALRGPSQGVIEAVSIGCPVGAGGPLDCAANFSVALSAMPTGLQITSPSNLLVLGFGVTNAKPILTTLTAVKDPSLKQTIFAGGLAQACDLSGKLPNAADDCTRATFSPLVIPGSPIAAGSAVLGIPVRTWTVNAPAQLPQGVALFVEKGCWGCEGYSTGLERVYRDAAGNVHTDTVFGGGFLSVSFSADAFEAYATVCIDVCGPLGPPRTGARTTIYHSVDGGITWTAEGTVDGIADMLLDGTHGWVLYQYIFNGGDSQTFRFSEYPSGAPITPPADAGPGVAFPGSRVLFTNPDYTQYLNLDGSSFLGGLPAQLADEVSVSGVRPVAVLGDDVVMGWQHPIGAASGPTSVPRTGILQAGKLIDVIEPGRVGPNVDIGTISTGGLVFGNADLAQIDVPDAKVVAPTDLAPHLPVLIDLAAGEVTPLLLYGDYLFDGAYAGRNYVVAAEVGAFARVNTGGDCLNVRRSTSTSSPSLGCFKDGVLLRVTDALNDQTADGIDWVSVMTPDGNHGWASAEFLQR